MSSQGTGFPDILPLGQMKTVFGNGQDLLLVSAVSTGQTIKTFFHPEYVYQCAEILVSSC